MQLTFLFHIRSEYAPTPLHSRFFSYNICNLKYLRGKKVLQLAEVKETIFGELSGKVGTSVFRVMNGKQFVSERPDKYKPTKSKALKAARFKFGLTVGFAKFINSQPVLKQIWMDAGISGINTYQKLIKCNVKLTGEKSLTIKNIISPPGIPSPVKNLSIDSDKIILSLNSSGKKSAALLKKPFRLHYIIYYYEAKKKIAEPYTYNYNVSDKIPSLLSKNYNVQLNLNEDQTALISKYKKQIIFITLVQVNVHKKVYWTSTFGQALQS